MKVAQVHVRYRHAGGEDAVVEHEASLLRSGGHEVTSVLLDNPLGVTGTALALIKAPWNASAARHVVAEVRRGDPDVVHVHNTWFALSAAVLDELRLSGLPTVLSVHNYRASCLNAVLLRDGRPCYDCLGGTPWPGVVHRCYRGSAVASAAAAGAVVIARRRQAWQAPDAVVVVGGHVREFAAASGFDLGRLHEIPHSVADRGQRGAPPSCSRDLLYVGRLSVEKGLDQLVRAWRTADPQGLRLVIAGEGPLRSELARDLPPNVLLLGGVGPEEVHRLMTQARAVLVPSIWDEMYGLVVAEAFCAATPVLASSRGGPRDLLGAAGLTSWLVEEGGWPSALTDLATGDLGRDADDAGRRARRYYESALTPERGLARLVSVYEAASAGSA